MTTTHSFETHRPKPSVFWSDEDLVALALLNDRIAYARIVEKHRGWVYSLCYRILRSRDSADDAAQEVFALALEKMATLEHGAKLAGWLKVIAVNQCYKIIEKGRPYAPFSNEEETRSPTLNPEQHLIASERHKLVGELIDHLPPKQRLVFVMKYVDGYTYRRIEELTGFSDMQVKSYLQNARRNFEKWWISGKAGVSGRAGR